MRLALASAAAAVAVAQVFDMEAEVSKVRAAGAKWEAGVNEKFVNATLDQIRAMLGTKRGAEMRAAQARLRKWDGTRIPIDALPTNFSVRTNWPACANITGHIRDQSACGSCWAFGSTEAFNDRLCIANGFSKLLSPWDTAACCNGNNGCFGSDGCNGGIPDEAWSYFGSLGVVTGGDYDDVGKGDSCAPYEFPFCSHHEQGKYPMCPTQEYSINSCPAACPETAYPVSWNNDKTMAKSAYNYNTVADAMNGMFAKGSITFSFDVYSDFLTYKSGVYQQTSGQLLGGHSVKAVGWGTTSDGTPYWLIQNSWNAYWGLNGDFMILRGQDECGIEDDMVAGDV